MCILIYTGGVNQTIQPLSQNVSVGDKAIFNCSISNASHFDCLINGSNYETEDTAIKNSFESCKVDNEETVYALVYIAVKVWENNTEYLNNSNISCRGFNKSHQKMNTSHSENASLMIQGIYN